MLARYDALQAKHDSVAYRKGIVGEMIDDFEKDYPHLGKILKGDYFGRVALRRDALGETEELIKYCGWGELRHRLFRKEGKLYLRRTDVGQGNQGTIQ